MKDADHLGKPTGIGHSKGCSQQCFVSSSYHSRSIPYSSLSVPNNTHGYTVEMLNAPNNLLGVGASDVFIWCLVCFVLMTGLSVKTPVPIHKVELDLLLGSGSWDMISKLLHRESHRALGPVKTILGCLPK